jgi:hypothetical protein
MRRWIAISLLMLVSWSLTAPIAVFGAAVNPSACCCGRGLCHCRSCLRHRTSERHSNQKAFAAITPRCPCCPASACAVHSPSFKPETSSEYSLQAVFRAALAIDSESRNQNAFLCAHPKRGPPAPLA